MQFMVDVPIKKFIRLTASKRAADISKKTEKKKSEFKTTIE